MEMKVCLFLKNHYLFNGGPKRRIKVLLLDKKKYTPMNQDRWYGGVRGRDKKNKSNRKKCEWVLGEENRGLFINMLVLLAQHGSISQKEGYK